MKHAYLIIAHGKWEQLKILLKQLDSIENDIFIHIDAKVNNVPIKDLKETVKFSKIEIFQKYKVYWGSLELTKTEIFLIKQAMQYNMYDYFHLLSGMDLMIKPLNEINRFFERNRGKEFIHFDTDKRLEYDKEILRRVKSYHFFTNFRRRYKVKILNDFFTLLEHVSLGIQEILKIDRTKKYNNFIIKYGSQWFSITNQFAKYVIENEKRIDKMFKHTKCSDELIMQSLIYNSKFKENLYNLEFDDNVEANMRLIDLKERGKNGSPYVWKISDFKEIKESKCLFARKFDTGVDNEIVKKIFRITME